MSKYIYFWVVFVIVRAIHEGYKNYKENAKAGYNIVYFENTGQKIEFNGSVGETVSCTLVASLGLIVSPIFLLFTTLFYLPAAFVLYVISK